MSNDKSFSLCLSIEGIVVLGAPVGYTGFVKDKLNARVEKVQEVVELLPLLEDPHTEFVLLRSCLALPCSCSALLIQLITKSCCASSTLSSEVLFLVCSALP